MFCKAVMSGTFSKDSSVKYLASVFPVKRKGAVFRFDKQWIIFIPIILYF